MDAILNAFKIDFRMDYVTVSPGFIHIQISTFSYYRCKRSGALKYDTMVEVGI